MLRRFAGGRQVAALALALGLVLSSAVSAFAHARFERTEPPITAPFDGSPITVKAYFSQELTSKSSIRVVDANGVQVDLGDGHVDLDDPIRKTMLVSLPALPVGVYTIEYQADSAEDGHGEPGMAQFGVGMLPAGAEQPATTDEYGPTGLSPEMARPLTQ
ncbi:MAG: copper resistance protein CopC [Chloroflexi bacterium]|nr:copper resistance protein CopC [Chloroflexota bacterium]